MDVPMSAPVRPAHNERTLASNGRRQQSLHTAVTSEFAASASLAYAAVTDRILRDKCPATHHTGYSKLAATVVPVTFNTCLEH